MVTSSWAQNPGTLPCHFIISWSEWKASILQAILQILPLKCFLNTTGEFGSLNMNHLFPLLGCNKPFFAPNAAISVCQDLVCLRHRNLCLTTITVFKSPEIILVEMFWNIAHMERILTEMDKTGYSGQGLGISVFAVPLWLSSCVCVCESMHCMRDKELMLLGWVLTSLFN